MKLFSVGLTGGLASGKTTVLRLFQQYGAGILSADETVHQLIQANGTAYSTIVDHFGDELLTDKHEIDRKKLRKVVFNHPQEKAWLENYLHPLVRTSLLAQRKNLDTFPYVVVEIPLLAETKTPYHWIQRILVVDCEQKTQQERAQQRSGHSYLESKQIIDQQASRQKRNSIAHDILLNHGDLSMLELQVKALHNKYLAMALNFE